MKKMEARAEPAPTQSLLNTASSDTLALKGQGVHTGADRPNNTFLLQEGGEEDDDDELEGSSPVWMTRLQGRRSPG